MKKYKTYKDSGVEWIGEIPEGWDVSKLKYVAFIRNSSIDRHIHDDELQVKVIHYPDVYKNEKINKDFTFGKGTCKESEFVKFTLNKGDIVITKDSERPDDIAVPCFINEHLENVVCGYHLTIITSDNSKIFGEYIFRFFQHKGSRSYFEISANGITRFGLGQSSIFNFSIPLPPIQEQKTIAQYLDQKTTIIDTLLQKTKQKITTLQEQRTAIINQAVTKGLTHLPPAKGGTKGGPTKDSGVEWIGEIPESWFCPKKKYICEFVLDGTHSSFARVDEGGYRLLSVRNIINNKFVFREDDSRVSEEDFHSISSKFLIQEGDIQLAIVGATLGKVAIVEKMEELFVTQRSVATIRVKKEKCNNKFLFYFFNTSLFQRFLWQNTGFSAQPGIYLGTLQNINVPLPAKKEQEKIVDFLNHKTTQLDTLIQKEKQRIDLLKEYRQSLISEVVTGKRCVLNEIPVA